MSRKCQREGCDKALPPAAATQRKFCSTRCQVADWRARNKPRRSSRSDSNSEESHDA